MNRLRLEDGIKAAELGVALFLVAALAALAVPTIGGITDGVSDVVAAGELRNAVVQTQGELIIDGEVTDARVAGVGLVKSADGQARCLWTRSGSGAVLGVWESGETRLYGRFEQSPDRCPGVSEVLEFGFGTDPDV